VNKTAKTITAEFKAMLNSITSADNEIDYVAVLDFGTQDGPDVFKVSSTPNPQRQIPPDKLIQTISVERDSYRVNPLAEDKIVVAKTALYRFCPTGLGDKVIMFACYEKGDLDTFRAAAHKHRQGIIDKLQEWEKAL
jgi:hypothetical protein